MLLIDDILVRPFVSFLDILHDMALKEQYDLEAIDEDLKENQLLFEIGERSREEYERRRAELEAEREMAERAQENLRSRAEVMR